MIWRGGCIIRARLLHLIREAYQQDADAPNLLLQPFFRDAVRKAEPNWRSTASLAVANGVPIPAFASALAYYDGMRRGRGPAKHLQGLRDYFGAPLTAASTSLARSTPAGARTEAKSRLTIA